MLKYCPKCGFEQEGFPYDGCPNCGCALLIRQSNEGGSQSIGADNEKQHSSSLNLGDGAAVMGNVSSSNTTYDNSTSSVVNNVTNITQRKSAAEIHEENVMHYRHRCRALCNDGLIDKEGEKELEILRSELGILPDEAKVILEEAKRLSKRLRTNLTMDGRLRIEKTINIITGNRKDALLSELNGLRQWKQEYDVEDLNQLYYQLFAILSSEQYINELETNGEDSYWSCYWGVVAYHMTGLTSKAEKLLAHLNVWDSLYPEQNKLLLAAVTALMQNDESTAREYYNAIRVGYSKSLEIVVGAVGKLLSMDWDSEIASLPASSQFYYDTLFKSYCTACRRHAEERRQERIRIQKRKEEEEEQKRQEWLQQQQNIAAVEAEARRAERQRQLEEERRRKEEAAAESAQAQANAEREQRERIEAERRAKREEARIHRAEWWRRNWKWFLLIAILGVACYLGYKGYEDKIKKQDEAKAMELKRQQDSIAKANRQKWFDAQSAQFEAFMGQSLGDPIKLDDPKKIEKYIDNGCAIVCQMRDTLSKYPELSNVPISEYVKRYNSKVEEVVRKINEAIYDPALPSKSVDQNIKDYGDFRDNIKQKKL